MFKDLLEKLKNKKVLTVILGAAAVNIILLLIFGISGKKPVLQDKQPISNIQNIIPGTTTAGELAGLPKQYAILPDSGQTKTIFVGENQPGKYSSLVTENNIVSKIIINDLSLFDSSVLSGYTQKYGQTDMVLYGPWQESGYISHIFLKPGLIVIAHQRTEEVIEIWKIIPGLTLSQFSQKFGGEFSDSLKQSHLR